MSKLCPKIILEGIQLTHKTEIALALNEHPRIIGPGNHRSRPSLISAEWCGFSNFPWGRGLINFNPEEEAQAMETYHTWLHLFELLSDYTWIIDRFHISTRLFQLQYHEIDYSFRWLEKRLEALGFHLVFISRCPESFQAAHRNRFRTPGDPALYGDLSFFLEEQQLLQKLVAESILPRMELDISDDDIPGAADRIVDWLEETGGLWAHEADSNSTSIISRSRFGDR